MLEKVFATDLPVIEVENTIENTTSQVINTDNTLLVFIVISVIVAIVAIITMIVLICVLCRRKKAKKKSNNITYVQENYERKTPQINKETREVTQRIPKKIGNTMHLWGTGDIDQKPVSLYLKDICDKSRSFRAPFYNEIVIGRKEGDIIIAEDSNLSRRHCKILRRGSVYYIEDLNSSNGTRYDGRLVQGETSILPGGILEIGRQTFKVEIIEVTK